MDKHFVHNAFLVLLQAGLWERKMDDLSCFPLPDEVWKDLFRLAQEQTVTGILFRGIQFLPDECLPPPALLMRWVAAVDAIERKNRKMNRVIDEFYTRFAETGPVPVLQKGQGVALCYASPLLRECGDIDFYFTDKAHSEKILSDMQKQGIPVRRQPDGSAFYVWQGIDIEHHTRLFDCYNPFFRKYLKTLERQWGWQNVKISQESGKKITIPSPFLNILLLNLHILKHTLGRGIGMRQLCDMARACYMFRHEIDDEKMMLANKRLGLEKWNNLLWAFLVNVLGFPKAYLPGVEMASTAGPLLDIVWKGGNFGLHAERSLPASASVFSRKMHTARSFLGNIGFSFRYAPKEVSWLCLDLLKGQSK